MSGGVTIPEEWGRRPYRGSKHSRKLTKLPDRKRTKADLAAGIVAYDRILAESTKIRKRHGLDPIADGPSIKAMRAAVTKAKPQAKPTPTQWRDLATAALETLGIPAPSKRGDVAELIEGLAA